MRLFKVFSVMLMCLIITTGAYAQGEWTSYTSSRVVYSMVSQGDFMWSVTEGGILKYNCDDLTYEKFITIDGTPVNSNAKIYVSPDGTVWCTLNGISQYDGEKWIRYTTNDGLSSNYITDVAFAPDSTIWIISGDSLLCFDGASWQKYSKDGGFPYSVNYVLDQGTRFLVDNSGIPWILTDDGIVKYEDEEWVTYTESDGIAHNIGIAIYNAPDGAVWCCHGLEYDLVNRKSVGMGVSRYVDGEWTVFTTSDGLGSNDISRLTFASDGSIWALPNIMNNLRQDTTISYYDGEIWTSFDCRVALGVDSVQSITIAHDGSVYAIGDSQVFRFDNGTWTQLPEIEAFEDPDAIGLQNIGTSLIASNGDIFCLCGYNCNLGSENAICRYNGEEWNILGCENSIIPDSCPIRIAIDSNGKLWSNFDWSEQALGLSWHDGDMWSHNTPDNEPAWNHVVSMANGPDASVWCITKPSISANTSSEISHFKNDIWENITLPEEYSLIGNNPIVVDKDDVVWLGLQLDAEPALGWYDGTAWEAMALQFSIKDMAIGTGGNIWCLGDVMMCRINPGADMPEIEYYEVPENMYVDNLFSIAIDLNNCLWIGSDVGVMEFDGDSWTNFTPDDGVSGRNIYDLSIDGNGDVWALTNTGVPYNLTALSRFDGTWWDVLPRREEMNYNLSTMSIDYSGSVWIGAGTRDCGVFRYSNESSVRYTVDDGLINNNVSCILSNSDNMVWFGTEIGISRFSSPPGVYVESEEFQPSEIIINGNYPNPFNPSTTIGFSLDRNEFTEFAIYNIAGQKVRTLIANSLSAGNYNVVWDGRNDNGQSVSSGIYIANIKAGSKHVSHRMTLMK